MRLKELRGLPVIDPASARKVGSVLDYQVDPRAGRLAALDVGRSEPQEARQRIPAESVRRVGRHAVILTGHPEPSAGGIPEVNEQWLDASSLVGLEVIGDDGNRIGHLEDAGFDQDTLAIDAYLLRTGPLARYTGRHGRIQPTSVHACSRELMMVSTLRPAPVEASATVEQSPPARSDRVPFKADDRVAPPTFDSVTDGQPVVRRG